MNVEARCKHKDIIRSEAGSSGTVVVVTLAFLTLTLAALSGWALYQYNQERTTVESQVAEAVTQARAEQKEEDELRFEEERRNPYRTYTAPDIYGGISLEFPRNWNVYVEDSTSSRTQVDLYMHPDMVRVQAGVDDPYAFRMELRNELYQNVVRNFQREIERGNLTSRTFTVSGIDGLRYSGTVSGSHTGSMVVLPYRDKAILMWTESNSYQNQFDEILSRARVSR